MLKSFISISIKFKFKKVNELKNINKYNFILELIKKKSKYRIEKFITLNNKILIIKPNFIKLNY